MLCVVFLLLLVVSWGLRVNMMNKNPVSIRSKTIKTLASGIVGVGASLMLVQSSRADTIANKLKELSCVESIVVLEGDGKKSVILVGTAHISDQSALLVKDVIDLTKPNIVMIELDTKRLRIGNEATSIEEFEEKGFIIPLETKKYASAARAAAPPPSKSIIDRIFGPVFGIADNITSNLVGGAIKNFYKSLESLGFTIGGEFDVAIQSAKKYNSKILLGDRDVDVTLDHLGRAIEATGIEAVQKALIDIDEFQKREGITLESESKESLAVLVEKIKQKDIAQASEAIIRADMPLVYNALIGERDLFMSNAIAEAVQPGQLLVSVVGLGHVEGMTKYLNQLGFKQKYTIC